MDKNQSLNAPECKGTLQFLIEMKDDYQAGKPKPCELSAVIRKPLRMNKALTRPFVL